MHACLKVPEILSLVLDAFIEPNVDSPNIRRPWPFEGSRTLVNLATSCQVFTEPALDRLWFFVPDLEDLVKCLPSDAWAIIADMVYGRAVTIIRPLSPSDFLRFNYYASKIQVLGALVEGQNVKELRHDWIWGPRMHPLMLPALLARKPLGLPLLPNLKRFNVRPNQYEGHPWYPRAAITPGLRFLDIQLHDMRSDRNQPIFCDAGQLLRNITETLEGLKISLLGRSSGLTVERKLPDALQALIPQFRRIQTLDLFNFGIDAASMQHIVSIPTIRRFSVTLGHDEMAAFIESNHKTSCRLREIAIRTDSLVQCTRLLHKLEILHIQSLDLTRRRSSGEDWDVKEFLQNASAWPSMQNITSLQIQAPLLSSQPQSTTSDITPEVIELILPFRRLRTLKLSMNGRVLLEPKILSQMADAWPSLEVLDLHERTLGAEPAITICDTARFIAACPALTELHLRMDASKPDLSLANVYNIPQSKTLSILDVCTSPLSTARSYQAHEGVSQFLAFSYPNLRTLDFGWRYYTEDGDPLPTTNLIEEQLHHGHWARVKEELSTLMTYSQEYDM